MRASDSLSSPHFVVLKNDDNVGLGLGNIMVVRGQGEGGRCQGPVFNVSVLAELVVRCHRGQGSQRGAKGGRVARNTLPSRLIRKDRKKSNSVLRIKEGRRPG